MTRLSALSMLRSALVLAVCIPASVAVAQDLNVNGSLCVGFDCPPPGGFGFDTIVLRENNLRIFFDDTSVSAGFPANKWRITINDSASGGANFFSVDDATASRSIFKVTAGAPANSLFISSTGNVGLGTAAPGLDLTISTSDTPAIRLEQTAGSFGAQTWDVAGNEANFFVRDVTGGSRLPFRIRPGAPTSSLDINASGNVGVGTASPLERLHVVSGSASTNPLSVSNTDATSYAQVVHRGTARAWATGVGNGSEVALGVANKYFVFDANAVLTRLVIDTSGNVGVGVTSPAARLHTVGSVRFAGVTGCTSGIQSNGSGDLSCLASSRQFKTITGDLAPATAVANIMALRPQTGSFKDTPGVPEHWFIAEEVAEVDPALVGLSDGKPYVVKTQNVVADLVAVVQQQQKQIEELRRLVAAK
jgi:hypothetical protein